MSRSLNLFYIQWPGYRDFKRQVQIRDETIMHNPITISKFAHHIGRSVDAFLRVRSSDLLRTIPVLNFSLTRLVSRTLGLLTAGASGGRLVGRMASSGTIS